jgi:hypothetical protein
MQTTRTNSSNTFDIRPGCRFINEGPHRFNVINPVFTYSSLLKEDYVVATHHETSQQLDC